jgi:hypothetical protein
MILLIMNCQLIGIIFLCFKNVNDKLILLNKLDYNRKTEELNVN